MDQFQCDLNEWVEKAPEDQVEFRQAVHTVLNAITYDLGLRESMVMKGGLLMAIRYRSDRFTKDLDFSTEMLRKDFNEEDFRAKLAKSLAMVVADSEYDLDCKIQGFKFQPANEDAQFPSIMLKIGYAYNGTPKHKRLEAGASPSIVKIDFSLNEPIIDTENIDLGSGQTIKAYAFSEIVAEKLRSLMQQEVRDRYRRQDIYDIRLLVEGGVSEKMAKAILSSLIVKSKARGIDPNPNSLADPELRRRAQRDYQTLKDEVEGDLPDFDESYNMVEAFYGSLPWSS